MNNIINKQPLYDQIVDLIKEKIETEYLPNSKLESERKLTERYGVSRTTVRMALLELEKLGYIYRKQGRGTYVSDLFTKKESIGANYSFTEHMKELGKKPETKILSIKLKKANKYFAQKMGLKLGEQIYKIKRLRLANGVPMMLERTYLPVKHLQGLTLGMLEKKPLYNIIEQDYRHKIKLAEEEIYASIARNSDSNYLEIIEGTAVLNLVRTTYDVFDEIIEFTLSVARADKFRYQVIHSRN